MGGEVGLGAGCLGFSMFEVPASPVPGRIRKIQARRAPAGVSSGARIIPMEHPIAVQARDIEDRLPRTQCRLCGFDGCRPYAEAIAAGRSAINRCPPGGDETIRELARLTGRPWVPLDPACGAPPPAAIAVIDESACIGCTLCLAACPVDAIVGAAKWMHTVIAAECTGCRLCVPPCPVDCIAMVETAPPLQPGARERSARYARRHDARLARLERDRAEAQLRKTAGRRKREAIERAMRRARERLQRRTAKA